MAKPRKTDRFQIGLILYALVLALAIGYGLHVFRGYLAAYEDSLSSHCLERYEAAMAQAMPKAAEEALSGLYPGIHSQEENTRWARNLLDGARLYKIASRSSETRQVYAVKADDGQQIGTVTLSVTGEDSYHNPLWDVTEEQFDFSAYYQTLSITVPADYSVYLGDGLLGADAIVETGIHYQTLEDYYSLYQDLPTLSRYEGGPFLGEAAFRLCDQEGNPVSPENWNESYFLDRCSQEIQERVDSYVPNFLYLYVNFSGDAHRTAKKYYDQLMPLVVSGGELQTRLYNALINYGYARTQSVKILSTEIHSVTPLDNDRYLVDLTYATEVTGMGDPVVIEDNIHLVLFDQKGKLLADSLYIY